MNYWLMKTEPNAYSWEDLEKDGQTYWDGVRNYAARKWMKEMRVGDQAFIYHSVKERNVVGIAEIIKEHYQDPTTDDDRWVAVDIKPLRKFKNAVNLDQVKADDRLQEMALVRIGRLSVQPVKKEEFDIIVAMSEQ